MNDDRLAFAAASRQLMRRIELHNLRGWRHHALGMLQAELSNDLRVHVWHPRLRDPRGTLFNEDGRGGVEYPPTPLRAVHDHRFTITSYIVAGQIVDVPYTVVLDGPNVYGYKERAEYAETDVFEIAHAKVQEQAAREGKLTRKIGRAFVRPHAENRYVAGDVYKIARRDFHTTKPVDLAVTVICRSDFDDEPARVLAGAESAIVPYSLDMLILRNWVLEQAEDLVVDTLRRMK